VDGEGALSLEAVSADFAVMLVTTCRVTFVDMSYSFPMEVHLQYLSFSKSTVHEEHVCMRN
jgi:hypothetical protein